jgi:transcriptional regulator with XRE-family HTH domain
MNYGKAINILRVDRMKQTQSIFAECIGITQTYLSQIETGAKKPSTDLLEKIAEYVDIPMPILFWNSITEEDVKEDRIEAYRLLKPTTDALVASFF